jgi:hypothetical protein
LIFLGKLPIPILPYYIGIVASLDHVRMKSTEGYHKIYNTLA